MKRLNLYGSAASFYIADLSFDYDKILVVVPEEEAQRVFREIKTFVDAYFLPAWDVSVDSGLKPSIPIIRERMRSCEAILNRDRLVLVTTVQGLAQGVCDPEAFMEDVVVVVKGASVDREEMARHLVDMGYNRVSVVEAPGGFSVRGDVIDVFPVNEENPYRIELWGDEVESIRIFDPATQRSLREAGAVTIFPFSERSFVPLSEVVDFDVIMGIDPDALESEREDASFWADREVDLPDFDIVLGGIPDLPKEIETGFLVDASLKGEKRIDFVVLRIRELLKSGFTGFVVADGEERVDALQQLFMERGLSLRRTKYKRGLVRTGLYLLVGHLSEGFVWEKKGIFCGYRKGYLWQKKAQKKKGKNKNKRCSDFFSEEPICWRLRDT